MGRRGLSEHVSGHGSTRLPDGIIPSFHRPALVNYWLKRFATDVLEPAGITDPVHQIDAFRCALPRASMAYPDHPVTGSDDSVDDSGTAIDPAILQQIIDSNA